MILVAIVAAIVHPLAAAVLPRLDVAAVTTLLVETIGTSETTIATTATTTVGIVTLTAVIVIMIAVTVIASALVIALAALKIGTVISRKSGSVAMTTGSVVTKSVRTFRMVKIGKVCQPVRPINAY